MGAVHPGKERMRKMKKIFALFVCFALAFSMCAFTTIQASAEGKYFESTLFVADDFEWYVLQRRI